MLRLPPDAPRVKVCCIANLAEAKLAIHWGATAIGLVSEMPSGPGVIDEEIIAGIVRGVPDDVTTFLLTARTDPDAIAQQQQRLGADTLQLVDRIEPDALRRLRELLPTVFLVQVIHVHDDSALDEAKQVAPLVDGLLLDSGNPELEVMELGGTGRTHDWNVSRRIVEAVDRPVYLAGGLNPDNVGTAIASVGPFGVDVCSGLRTYDVLDETLLKPFMENVLARREGLR